MALPFFSSTRTIPDITAVPRHIAIIMDGNGRWAKQRFMPRVMGHQRGVETVREMVKACRQLGVEYLTLFAFSSENWRRPADEVSFLMQLFLKMLEREVGKLHENNIRLKVIGDRSRFDVQLVRYIDEAEQLTANNTSLTLTIAANYGGRWDIMQAMHALSLAHPEQSTAFGEEELAPYLSMHYAPEPDLFIRTGGEQRISNFLLWQLAYTELYFTDTLWPAFDRAALEAAIQSYQKRERRFGRTSEQLTGIKRMLKQRIITAIILFVLFLAALFGLPTAGWQAVVLVVMWQGAVEWARLSGLNGRVATAYWTLTLALMAAMVWFDMSVSLQQQTLLHLAWYALAVLLWVFVVPAWLIAGWRPQNQWLMGVIGWVVLLPTGLAMLDLRAFSPWVLLFAMTLVMMADISAYFAGKRFGKNKLAPAISPGKTWEGVIGAMIGVTLYVIVVGWASGLYKHYPVFPGVIVAGWWWVALAVIGDLFESAIKRQAGVKDSGALLPGHGGLLDRIDALTSTLPFAGIALILQRLE